MNDDVAELLELAATAERRTLADRRLPPPEDVVISITAVDTAAALQAWRLPIAIPRCFPRLIDSMSSGARRPSISDSAAQDRTSASVPTSP